jgi:hypothetical protein
MRYSRDKETIEESPCVKRRMPDVPQQNSGFGREMAFAPNIQTPTINAQSKRSEMRWSLLCADRRLR